MLWKEILLQYWYLDYRRKAFITKSMILCHDVLTVIMLSFYIVSKLSSYLYAYIHWPNCANLDLIALSNLFMDLIAPWLETWCLLCFGVCMGFLSIFKDCLLQQAISRCIFQQCIILWHYYVILLFWHMKKGNVANQREHLILLLANIDVRHRSLENYTEVIYVPLRCFI